MAGQERELSGGEPSTTNNRMELMGAIAALERLREPCEVTLTSDSRYLVDAVTKGWAKSWRRNGWRKADKSPALNSDLWARLLEPAGDSPCDLHLGARPRGTSLQRTLRCAGRGGCGPIRKGIKSPT